jgi:hypothetical protein
LGGRVEVAIAGGGALDADGALFEVGLARDGIEGTESHSVRVGLGKMEGHENLAWGDDRRDTQLQIGNLPAT